MRCNSFWGNHVWPMWGDPKPYKASSPGGMTRPVWIQERTCLLCGRYEVRTEDSDKAFGDGS